MILEGKNGYKIAFEATLPTDAKGVILAMHGFCGDKESSCISALEKRAVESGIGLVKFDWPGHGESEATGRQLTIENCLADIDSLVAYIKSVLPQAKLIAFATSFGGYLALLYCYRNRDVFDRVILRSPAINMSEVLEKRILTEDDLLQIKQVGFANYGFERKLEITDSFLDELRNNNVSKLYDDVDLPKISIIHGTNDDLVPFADSKSFSERHGCKLYPVNGADHRYKKPGELDKVIDIAMHIMTS